MPLAKLAGNGAAVVSRTVRTEPIQQRSSARLDSLLDSAAQIVDQIGFARITTAMVAERAGASIGTVYRYFPDRVAVLKALHDRSMLRFRARVAQEIQDCDPQNWWEAVDAAITAFVALYRTEPGFRIIHFADREIEHDRGVRELPAGADEAADDSFAARLATVLTEEFGLDGGPELHFRLEVAIEMADGLLARAFIVDPAGDERFISECRALVHGYLTSHYAVAEAA